MTAWLEAHLELMRRLSVMGIEAEIDPETEGKATLSVESRELNEEELRAKVKEVFAQEPEISPDIVHWRIDAAN